jgi:hypothetical protein
VRAHALALAAALLGLSLVGSPLDGLITSSACALLALWLRGRYRSELVAARVNVPPHRERLDRIVDGDLQTVLAVGLTAGGVMLGFGIDPAAVGLSRWTPLMVALAAAGVYLSSLVDWYVILPRISGMLGARPCREDEERHPRFPHTWRETTRWWLVHRSLALLVFRFGLAFALTLSLARHISVPAGASIVAGAALGFAATYLKVIPAAGFQAGHPTMIVGHTVGHAETKRVRRRVRLFGRSIPLPLTELIEIGEGDGRDWVYDIALEGVQVVPATSREGEVPRTPDGKVRYERRPRKIPLRDIGDTEPAEPFRGCRDRCSGINWYCIENPDCFRPK